MRFHASCAAWPQPDRNDAVLLLGPPGAGKSDLLLRLIDSGWHLVADDQVLVTDGIASAPAPLAGMIELRGLGLFRLPHLNAAPLRLAVQLADDFDEPNGRLPLPRRHAMLGVPLISLNPALPSAPARLRLALDCACGRAVNVAGAFAA